MTNYLRPDEQATESEIRKSRGRTEEVRSGLQTAASFAAPYAGKEIYSKIAPFLSQYLPADISIKGISKMFPKVGKFLKNGIDQGLSLESGLDFLRTEMGNEEKKQEIANKNTNIIEQYSPELHQFIKGELAKGRPHLEAGALAQVNDKFKKVIKKIEEDHKTPFSSILDTTYGGGQHGGSVNPPLQNQQTQQQQGTQQGQQQPGQGQQALMSILQKIQQQRGG